MKPFSISAACSVSLSSFCDAVLGCLLVAVNGNTHSRTHGVPKRGNSFPTSMYNLSIHLCLFVGLLSVIIVQLPSCLVANLAYCMNEETS